MKKLLAVLFSLIALSVGTVSCAPEAAAHREFGQELLNEHNIVLIGEDASVEREILEKVREDCVYFPERFEKLLEGDGESFVMTPLDILEIVFCTAVDEEWDGLLADIENEEILLEYSPGGVIYFGPKTSSI